MSYSARPQIPITHGICWCIWGSINYTCQKCRSWVCQKKIIFFKSFFRLFKVSLIKKPGMHVAAQKCFVHRCQLSFFLLLWAYRKKEKGKGESEREREVRNGPFGQFYLKHDGFGSCSGQHAIVYMWEGLLPGWAMRFAEVKFHSINKDFEILWLAQQFQLTSDIKKYYYSNKCTKLKPVQWNIRQ